MTHDDLIARLRELHKAATPGNLSTSEIIEDGEFICPHCDGTGEVAGEQYINYDGVAANVLFSGIGHEFVANRDWYIAISRDWPEIDDALTAAQAENQRLRKAEKDAVATLTAWFDRRKLAHEAIDQAVIDAVEGYLRTSRAGGMPQSKSDLVLGVISDMARLSLFADLFARAALNKEASHD